MLAAVLQGMLERGRGHIVIMGSLAGLRGLPLSTPYGATKAALTNLAESLRFELNPRGIAISIVNPGFVAMPLTRDNDFPMPGLMTVEMRLRLSGAASAVGTSRLPFRNG